MKEPQDNRGGLGARLGGAILGAALALPGLAPVAAQAETAPEHGQIGLRYLQYRDWQPGLSRISVHAPSLSFLAPVAGTWSIAGSFVQDSVSGASPRWHTSIASASRMSDLRNAGDLRVTRYYSRSSWSVGYSSSSEHDYDSQALSATASFSSDDNNRTWTIGAGRSWDRINPVNQIVTDERRFTTDLMVGVTQVLTPRDLVQLNLTHARGRGYLNDPYKLPDSRPRERDQTALQLRWNHHFEDWRTTLRLGHRFYSDSFGVTGNTTTVEYVIPRSNGWTVTPTMRYHTQSAAKFYYDPVYDPVLGAPFPPGYATNPNGLYSADQRLSAFGAVSIGIRVSKAMEGGWLADFRADYYQQRGQWRLLGTGSPGLAPFSALLLQAGVNKTF